MPLVLFRKSTKCFVTFYKRTVLFIVSAGFDALGWLIWYRTVKRFNEMRIGASYLGCELEATELKNCVSEKRNNYSLFQPVLKYKLIFLNDINSLKIWGIDFLLVLSELHFSWKGDKFLWKKAWVDKPIDRNNEYCSGNTPFIRFLRLEELSAY